MNENTREQEKEFNVSYSASNEKTVWAGTFTIGTYGTLKDSEVVTDTCYAVLNEVDLEEITSLSITIELVKK